MPLRGGFQEPQLPVRELLAQGLHPLAGAQDIRDPDPQSFVDDDYFSAGKDLVVNQKVQGFIRPAVQLNHRVGT